MQVKKQQLELTVEHMTCSKLGKDYIKAVYCQESRFPGEQPCNPTIPLLGIYLKKITLIQEDRYKNPQ